LIIWGAADRIIAPAYADEFARRITNSRVAMIEAAGHLPHLEKPQDVARLALEFLADRQRGGRLPLNQSMEFTGTPLYMEVVPIIATVSWIIFYIRGGMALAEPRK